MDFSFLWQTLLTLAPGIPLTFVLAFSSVAIGFVIASFLASARVWGPRWLAGPARTYVFVLRGTPLLVQIFLIYYGLGQFAAVRSSLLWPFLREPFWCAILALSLNTSAYGAEILRGALLSVPIGQIEAARACGMSPLMSLHRIVGPQAIRNALPAYGNELILMVKSTSLASVITLMEITGLAAQLISETYRVVPVFIVAGAIYLALNFILATLVGLLDYRLAAHLRPTATAAFRSRFPFPSRIRKGFP
jgi:octopine/nopaline transport system permease protein